MGAKRNGNRSFSFSFSFSPLTGGTAILITAFAGWFITTRRYQPRSEGWHNPAL